MLYHIRNISNPMHGVDDNIHNVSIVMFDVIEFEIDGVKYVLTKDSGNDIFKSEKYLPYSLLSPLDIESKNLAKTEKAFVFSVDDTFIATLTTD